MSRNYKKWTPEENAKLTELYPDKPNSELAEIFGVTIWQIKGKAQRMGLRKSDDHMERSSLGRFAKGMTPWNKGLSYMPKNAATRFKKGNKPHTWRPIGTISNRSGRKNEWVIKVSDTGDKITDWRPLGEYVWTANGGEPPTENEIIRFKNNYVAKSPDCYKFDRLEKISRAENMARNTIHNLPEPLKKDIRALSRLRRVLNDISK